MRIYKTWNGTEWEEVNLWEIPLYRPTVIQVFDTEVVDERLKAGTTQQVTQYRNETRQPVLLQIIRKDGGNPQPKEP